MSVLKSEKVTFVAPALAFVLVTLVSLASGDTLWSVRLGEDFFAGENLWKERWSWTAYGDFYPNHEWAFEAIAYSLYWLGGESFFLHHVLNGLLAGVSLWLLRPTAEILSSMGLKSTIWSQAQLFALPILGVSLLLFWEVRAASFSVFFIAVLFRLLLKEKYWWIPLVIALWANFHGGFVLGCYIIFCAWLVAAARAIWLREGPELFRAKKLFLVGIASFVASLATPMHWKNWEYALFKASDPMKEAILEFKPLIGYPSGVEYLVGVTLIAALVAALHWKQLLSSYQANLLVAIPLMTLPLAFIAIRFFVFFSFLLIPLVSLSLASRGEGISRKLADNSLFKKTVASFLLLATLGGLSTAWIKKDKDNEDPFPDAVHATLANCGGHIYNDYFSGAYLAFWVRDVPVYQDNRYDPYPKSLHKYLSITRSNYWLEHIEKSNIECALFSLHSEGTPPGVVHFKLEKLYEDSRWGIYRNPNYDPSKPTKYAPLEKGSYFADGRDS